MERFIGRSLILSLGVYFTDYLIKGFWIVGQNKEYWFNFIMTILVFYIFNFAIMPILKILTLPITFLSFGLFYFLLIVGSIKIIDKYIDFFYIEGGLSLIAVSVMMAFTVSLAKNL